MSATTLPTATPYAEGNRLFRGTRWRGSDDASTLDLGDGRTLWLFGDTFVADAGADKRPGSHFVNNTIGLQTGSDPATATMEFRWEDTPDGPQPFFPNEDPEHYFWPYHGVRLGDRVLAFCMLVGPPSGLKSDSGVWDEIPFTVDDWRAFWIDGVEGPVADWTVTPVSERPAGPGLLGARLLLDGDWLYAWSYRDGVSYLARFDVATVSGGDLSSPLWWDGTDWDPDVGAAVPALDPSTTEGSVHKWHDGRYLHVDVYSFGVPETGVQLRWADRPEGPWSERTEVFRIPEASRDGVIAYAGKGHPELGGPGLLVTYATNTGGLDDVIWTDESLYYPMFVRVDI